jgi:hypothetical protein
MRSYSSTTPVNAAKIIAVQRASDSGSTTYTLVCEAPEVSVSAATFETVTTGWMAVNSAVVGGYLVDNGTVKIFMPATAFEALYTLVP